MQKYLRVYTKILGFPLPFIPTLRYTLRSTQCKIGLLRASDTTSLIFVQALIFTITICYTPACFTAEHSQQQPSATEVPSEKVLTLGEHATHYDCVKDLSILTPIVTAGAAAAATHAWHENYPKTAGAIAASGALLAIWGHRKTKKSLEELHSTNQVKFCSLM